MIRNDLDEPVMVAQMENDVGGLQARQADDDHYRLWEIAGTAHFDQYGLAQARNDVGDRDTVAEWFDTMRNPAESTESDASAAACRSTPARRRS